MYGSIPNLTLILAIDGHHSVTRPRKERLFRGFADNLCTFTHEKTITPNMENSVVQKGLFVLLQRWG